MGARFITGSAVAVLLAAGCGGGGGAAPTTVGAVSTVAPTPATAPASSSTVPATTSVSPASIDCPAVTRGGNPELGILGGAVSVFDAATGAFAWEVEVGTGASVAGTADVVVVGDDTAVRAYDAGSGALRWCRTPAGVVAVAGQTVVVLAPTGTLTGVDPSTGQERWSVNTAPSPEGGLLPGLSSPLLGGRTNAYLDTSMLSPPGSVIAIDPATGATRWTWTPTGCDAAQAGQPVPPGQPVPVCVGGPWTPIEGPLVYLSDTNAARIIALDPNTGAQRWALASDGQSGAISTSDNTVAFVSSTFPTAPSGEGETPPPAGRLVAVDATSGTQRWTTPFAPSGLEPVATGDLVVTLTQSDAPSSAPAGPVPETSTRVDALVAATGTVTWTHQLTGETPATITPVGDVLVMASTGPKAWLGFLALDPANGEERWRTEHRPAYTPTTAFSTSGYEPPIAVADGSRFASLITYGTAST